MDRTTERDVMSGGAETGRGDVRRRAALVALRRGVSPLTRKIVVFNLIALNLLLVGMLFLGAGREDLLDAYRGQRGVEAKLMAEVLAPLPGGALSPSDVAAGLARMPLQGGQSALVFAPNGTLLGQATGPADPQMGPPPTPVVDAIEALWRGFGAIFLADQPDLPVKSSEEQTREVLGDLQPDQPLSRVLQAPEGRFLLTLVAIDPQADPSAVLALVSPLNGLDTAARAAGERALRGGALATLISVVMSLLLASTIARPLADLAAAAESGADPTRPRRAPVRVNIPDMTARSDEIGHLSGALRGMVAALYERIESNEQFAADVAHEIKNPLASLRAAAGTLRMAKRQDHRDRLIEVIEHDVRRLDRLVSDISNASRLDSDLVKEEEEEFDLLTLLRGLTQYLGGQAAEQGIEFMTDLPDDQITLRGLEPRLAQVFVNLISNAISLCQQGDAIRVWVRRRAGRVLVVVEDTGPGIPEEALQKVFARFYSQRPEADFGNHSGLGLAISKQIVEAHGGVIWAENIRVSGAKPTSGPLGARFVVGLPV